MDRKIVFTLVFFLTLVSTLLVIVVGILSQQRGIYVALYALATMWIMGVVSQLLVKHLYFSVVRPIELTKIEEQAKKVTAPTHDIEGIEEIDQLEPQSADLFASEESKGTKAAPIAAK